MTDSGVPRSLLDIMQCPACGGGLVESAEPAALTCVECGLAYPVVDGIPVMLIEEASPRVPDAPSEGAS